MCVVVYDRVNKPLGVVQNIMTLLLKQIKIKSNLLCTESVISLDTKIGGGGICVGVEQKTDVYIFHSWKMPHLDPSQITKAISL